MKLTINEEIYLIAIWHLKDKAYGVKIREKILDLTGNDILLGTLYNTLNQLIKKEYVITRKGEPTHQRGGHNKVYYSITKKAEKALKLSHQLKKKLWHDIPEGVFEG